MYCWGLAPRLVCYNSFVAFPLQEWLAFFRNYKLGTDFTFLQQCCQVILRECLTGPGPYHIVRERLF